GNVVHLGPVGAAEILDPVRAVLELDHRVAPGDHRILGADGALHRATHVCWLEPKDDRAVPSLRVLIHDFRRHVASLPHFQVMDLNLNSVWPQVNTSLSTSSCWVTRF